MKKKMLGAAALACAIAAFLLTGCLGNSREIKAAGTKRTEGLTAVAEQTGELTAGTDQTAEAATGTKDGSAGASPPEVKEKGDGREDRLTGEPIRIGAIYALSGNNAAIGTNILRGIDFAVEDINMAGGVNGRPIEIVRGDTQGNPEVARAVAERLITQDKVHAIVGCHQSTLTEIVFEVCESYKIPMITAISTVDSISSHNYEYSFRLCPMSSLYL